MQEWTLEHPYLTTSLVALFMILMSGTIRDIFGKPQTKDLSKKAHSAEEQDQSNDTQLN